MEAIDERLIIYAAIGIDNCNPLLGISVTQYLYDCILICSPTLNFNFLF